MAFPEVVEKLCAEARKPENRGYADNGDAVLKAGSRTLPGARLRRPRALTPETEVIHSIGSKAALSILPAALVNPGDYVLMTTPGYPVFGTHAKYLGGRVHNLPLTRGQLVSARPGGRSRRRAGAGQGAGAELPEQPDRRERDAGVFRAGGRVRAQAITWSSSTTRPMRRWCLRDSRLSFLATPGAKEVGVELHSASKSFNMTGWRCGFVAGNELLVRAYGDVKDNTDSGQFLAIQHAAAHGLDHPEITREDCGEVFAAHGRPGGGA